MRLHTLTIKDFNAGRQVPLDELGSQAMHKQPALHLTSVRADAGYTLSLVNVGPDFTVDIFQLQYRQYRHLTRCDLSVDGA